MKKPSNEELVAYLDGELEAAAADEVERAIAADAHLQHEVDSMVRAFDMLETLVAPQASQEFTQRTLHTVHSLESPDATVQREAGDDAATRLVPAVTSGGISTTLLATWAVGLVFCSAIGFLCTNRWFAPQRRDIAHDLPVIEQLNLFQDAHSVEFVEALLERQFQEPLDPNHPQPNAVQPNGDPGPLNPIPGAQPVPRNGGPRNGGPRNGEPHNGGTGT